MTYIIAFHLFMAFNLLSKDIVIKDLNYYRFSKINFVIGLNIISLVSLSDFINIQQKLLQKGHN